MLKEDYIITEANTYEEAVSAGLKKLNKQAEEVEIEIIERPKKLFNLVLKPYKIMIRPIQPVQNDISDVDGSYTLEYKDDGVYITIIPPKGKGKSVDEMEIVARIKRKCIEQVDNKAIFAVFSTSDVQQIKIAPPQQEKLLDAEVVVSISDDKMRAYVYILPEDGGKPCNEDMIKARLKEAGVEFGIKWDIIADICAQKRYEQNILVAEGIQPVDGNDGKVEFLLPFNKEAKPTVLEDGTVDYKHLNLINNVRKGDVLACLIPPTQGTSGRTVLGKEIPARNGKPANLPIGKNVERSEEGNSVIASIDGQAVFLDNKISVRPVYEVATDVDNSTGNIEFVGSVKVMGNVLTGFSIKADGDVEISGVVEGAFIEAKGNIILKSGVQGMNRAILKAGGNIIARFIENSMLEANGDVRADAIMHSKVKALGNIYAEGKKGLIVGGTIRAASEINAKNIGSTMATSTELEVGISPELRERYNEINIKLEELNKQLKTSEQDIQTLDKLQAVGKISENKQRLRIVLVQKKLNLVKQITDYKAELVDIEHKLEELTNGKVNVYGTIYPGVRITIGNLSLQIKEEYHYATFKRECGEIVMVSYEKRSAGKR